MSLITHTAERLVSDFGLWPIVASEIEFYLEGDTAVFPAFEHDLRRAAEEESVRLCKYEAEKGVQQFEVALLPSVPSQAAADTSRIKSLIHDTASTHGLRAVFTAKPYADQPGSGLHIHVHLADQQGKNLFYKDDENISDVLRFSLGGLLAWLPDCMAVFAPFPESYTRFSSNDNTPQTISWGANNRTVALRLPDAARDNKHIEHRVPGSDANPEHVIAVILAAMHWGITHKATPNAQIYGNATLAQYALPRLTNNLEEATACMQHSKIIAEYFIVSDLLPDR